MRTMTILIIFEQVFQQRNSSFIYVVEPISL